MKFLDDGVGVNLGDGELSVIRQRDSDGSIGLHVVQEPWWKIWGALARVENGRTVNCKSARRLPSMKRVSSKGQCECLVPEMFF